MSLVRCRRITGYQRFQFVAGHRLFPVFIIIFSRLESKINETSDEQRTNCKFHSITSFL